MSFRHFVCKLFASCENKKGLHIYKPLTINVIRIGFEPMTYCLEGSCSIQLSYRTVFPANVNLQLKTQLRYRAEL